MSLAVFNVPAGDIRYPTALAAIHDPPPTLFIKGQIEALRAPSVAVVGSRVASPYALEVSRRLGADLARRGICVVSGMARGATGSHPALEAGGAHCRSAACRHYYAWHARRGSVCDAVRCQRVPPGMPPRKPNFPQRNRIIVECR